MQVINVQQGSEEWQAERRCRITGTKLDSVCGTPLARTQLIAELIAEEATESTKTFKATAEMERGTEEEPKAIEAFTQTTGKVVNRDTGIWVSDEFDFLAFSPDGVISEEEIVEVKNPDTKTMMFYKIANMIPLEETKIAASKQNWIGVPKDYQWQVVCAFLVNPKLKKLHFLIHDDRILIKEEKLYTVLVERENPEMQKALKEAREEIIKFRADWLRWKEVVLPSHF